MVRLNKKQLPEKQLEELFDQLNHSLAILPEKQTNDFLSDLLGKEEKIMLAKRLAVIILLLEDKTLYRISRILKVSPATAEKINDQLEAGRYDRLLHAIGKNKKEYFSILETLDNILHLGGILPHYNGLDRYRFLK